MLCLCVCVFGQEVQEIRQCFYHLMVKVSLSSPSGKTCFTLNYHTYTVVEVAFRSKKKKIPQSKYTLLKVKVLSADCAQRIQSKSTQYIKKGKTTIIYCIYILNISVSTDIYLYIYHTVHHFGLSYILYVYQVAAKMEILKYKYLKIVLGLMLVCFILFVSRVLTAKS